MIELVQKAKVELLSNTPHPEQVIAAAGKLCYSPVGVKEILEKTTEEQCIIFLKRLLSMGHESPLEHVSFTFAVENVSRALTHQLVRHRIASYSQQSQRYVKNDEPVFIIPKLITDLSTEQNMLELAYKEALENVFDAYTYLSLVISRELISQKLEEDPSIKENPKRMKKLESDCEKIAIENARYVLPNSAETKIVFTMNLRTLINFLSERCCNRAQWEIREMARQIIALIYTISPAIAHYLGAPCEFGSCPEGNMCCGQPFEKKKK